MLTDLYSILGIARGAGLDEIKQSYHYIMKKMHHPDAGGEPKIFHGVQQAFDILSNPDLRFLYDMYPYEPGRGMNAIDEFLGFENTRANHQRMMNVHHERSMKHEFPGVGTARMPRFERKNPMRGKDDHRKLMVRLEDVFNGNTLSVTMDRLVHCRGCRGKNIGVGHHDSIDCSLCEDECPLERRIVERPHPIIKGMLMTQEIEVASEEKCHQQKFDINVKIPQGVVEGFQIRFPRTSHHLPGILPGDLIVHINIAQHSLFKRAIDLEHHGKEMPMREAKFRDKLHGRRRQGQSHTHNNIILAPLDLYLQVNVSLVNALLGFHRVITQLDGTPLILDSKNLSALSPGDNTGRPHVLSHGHQQVIRGHGMPKLSKSVGLPPKNAPSPNSHIRSRETGDLIVEYAIAFPAGPLNSVAKSKLTEALG